MVRNVEMIIMITSNCFGLQVLRLYVWLTCSANKLWLGRQLSLCPCSLEALGHRLPVLPRGMLGANSDSSFPTHLLHHVNIMWTISENLKQ